MGSTISSLVAKYQVAQTGVTTPVRSHGGQISNLVKSVQNCYLCIHQDITIQKMYSLTLSETSCSRVKVKKSKAHFFFFLLFLAIQGSDFEKLSNFYKIGVKLLGVKQEFRSGIV